MFLVTVSFTNTATVSGGDLGSTFKAAQFHFHWGSDNTKGSEHTYNGKNYPAEVKVKGGYRSFEVGGGKGKNDRFAINVNTVI